MEKNVIFLPSDLKTQCHRDHCVWSLTEVRIDFFFFSTKLANITQIVQRKQIDRVRRHCFYAFFLQRYFHIFENIKRKFLFLRGKFGQYENIWTPDTGQLVRSKYLVHLLLWHMKLFIKIKAWFIISLCTLFNCIIWNNV